MLQRSRHLYLPDFDPTATTDVTAKESRANQYRSNTKRRQSIGEITSSVASNSKKVQRKRSLPSAQLPVPLVNTTATASGNDQHHNRTIDNIVPQNMLFSTIRDTGPVVTEESRDKTSSDKTEAEPTTDAEQTKGITETNMEATHAIDKATDSPVGMNNEPERVTTTAQIPVKIDREQELRAQLLERLRVPPRREESKKRQQPERTDDSKAPTTSTVASRETNTNREEKDQTELYGEQEDWRVEAEEAMALLTQETESTNKKGRNWRENETTPTRAEANSRDTQEEDSDPMHHEGRRRPRIPQKTRKRSKGSRQQDDNKSYRRYKRG